MSLQPAAASYIKGSFGALVAGHLCAAVVNLPLFPYMTEAEQLRVVEVVGSVLGGGNVR